ncbi:MAG TPA: ribonuclease J [Alphaproteobacteria bacterium]
MTAQGELLFVPLGGAGEIGMNLNLYGLDGKWLMLDCGVSFADEWLPGVDLVMPDPAFIEARRDALLAIVLTHAHEDHLGAVPHLWPRLGCPVYATPFAAAVLRRKLAEVGLEEAVDLRIVPLKSRFEIGPFDLELITVTHSILEPNAVALRTRLGTILHTGDFKIDPDPLIGEETDAAALAALGEEGVLAMVCDSTNVFRPGESGSEGELRRTLDELIRGREGRVVVTSFASNAARIETVAKCALRNGRHVALAGRSLWRIVEAAREAGYLRDLPPLLPDNEAGFLPRDKVLVLATGCQGEPRAAMAKIAADEHPHIALDPGDLVVFSSKIIPGNEKAIFRMHNRLVGRGIEVVTEADHFVHVSGHPAREELARMYRWVRPRIAVPVHGERRHIAEHAAFARSLQVPQAIEVENGCVVRLAPGEAGIVDHVESGRLALDGNTLLPVDSEVMRGRRRLMVAGVVFVTLVMDRAGKLQAAPTVRAEGVFADGAEAGEELSELVRDAVEALPRARRGDDETVRETARLSMRREIQRRHDKRPMVAVELVRL